MNTAEQPMYGWNILLCTQDMQAPKAHLPSLTRGTDDNIQAIEEPDEATSLTSGSEAERRGRPRRLGYP